MLSSFTNVLALCSVHKRNTFLALKYIRSFCLIAAELVCFPVECIQKTLGWGGEYNCHPELKLSETVPDFFGERLDFRPLAPKDFS